MAIDGISITLDQVTEVAAKVDAINDKLTSKLDELNKEMLRLKDTWTSDASSTIQQKFSELAQKFGPYQEVIKSYTAFLNQTVTEYNTAEDKINTNAGQFK